MTTVEKIEKELVDRFMENGFKAVTMTMECNGDRVTITPCGYKDITSIDDVEFFLMDSGKVNFCGGESLTYVAKCISEYEDRLAEDARAVESLKKYIREHGERSNWDVVSDWHKDIFGHRPHVSTEQIIRWANGGSSMSARYA